MERKQIESRKTDQGCNVLEVTHEDGSKEITMDTGQYRALRLVGSVYDHGLAYDQASGERLGRVWP